MKYLFIPVLALLIFSCTEDGPEKNVSVPEHQPEYSGENLGNDSLLNAKDTIVTDTAGAFRVSGKAIVFFIPTDKEFETIVEKEREESGIYEVSSDFSYYANEVIDSLKKSSLKALTTKQPVIVISYGSRVKVVDRRKLDNIVGCILTDGIKEPEVYTGVYTDLDYWEMINKFFGKLK